jgi:ribonuclease P protein component
VHASTNFTSTNSSVENSVDEANVKVGFVVSKAVGNSVVRHRVTRRFRHVVSARLGTLLPGSSLVVRALPPAASASSAELALDLDAALRRLGLVSKQIGGVGEFRETSSTGTDYPNGPVV